MRMADNYEVRNIRTKILGLKSNGQYDIRSFFTRYIKIESIKDILNNETENKNLLMLEKFIQDTAEDDIFYFYPHEGGFYFYSEYTFYHNIIFSDAFEVIRYYNFVKNWFSGIYDIEECCYFLFDLKMLENFLLELKKTSTEIKTFLLMVINSDNRKNDSEYFNTNKGYVGPYYSSEKYSIMNKLNNSFIQEVIDLNDLEVTKSFFSKFLSMIPYDVIIHNQLVKFLSNDSEKKDIYESYISHINSILKENNKVLLAE